MRLTVYWLKPQKRGEVPVLLSFSDAAIRPVLREQTMPKLKTHSGAAKRFKKTGTGKIKRGHTKVRHILTSKAPKQKRKLGKSAIVSDGDHAKVARMIPYA
jgi:large subunit ribosomal protein L35